MGRLKKIIKRVLIIISIAIALVIIFISPITKHLIEKYDKTYTGREIYLDWAYVNPFTGYLHLSNLKIQEHDNDSTFFFATGLSANVAMGKLLSNHYELSEITLDNPKGYVLQNLDLFNFSDLIIRFLPKKDSISNREPLHLNLLNIKINNGEFYYSEAVTPIYYFIKNVNIECPAIKWDVDTIPIQFAFASGIGSGNVKGDFTVNSRNKDYRLGVVVDSFDLNIVGQYVKDLVNYGSFRAMLDADFKSNGNLVFREDVTNSGLISISDFHFGKDSTEDYAAFENLTFDIKEVSPKKLKYYFDSISLKHPYFKYEKYDYLDNIETMFGEESINVSQADSEGAKFNLVIAIAEYIKTISKNLLKSNYKIGHMAIYSGEIKYDDYSLGEKFSVELNPLNFVADSIEKIHERVHLKLTSNIQPYGSLAFGVSINPKDSSDFDLNYKIQHVPVSLFNPYLIKYTSFPLDRGTVELHGKWHVRNGEIESNNHVIIIDPRIGQKVRNKNTNWLPMHLAMFFARERGNVIDYEVPIQGNLNNPNFKLHDVVVDALKNIFVKPATTPYRMEVKNLETEIEKSLTIKWEMRKSSLTSDQENFIQNMADFLEENPEANITFRPMNYELKEKEYILFFEAKKKYYNAKRGKNNSDFDESDSVRVDKMSIKDSLFVRYLNDNISDALLFTVQDKCMALVGSSAINSKYNTLNNDRKKVLMEAFKENGTDKRITISEAKSVIPYNGYSFYVIDYNGILPEYLLKDYRKMYDLNNEAPRDKFNNERKKIGKLNHLK